MNRCRKKPSQSFLYLTESKKFWERNYHQLPSLKELHGHEEDGRDHLRLHKKSLSPIFLPPVCSPRNSFVLHIEASVPSFSCCCCFIFLLVNLVFVHLICMPPGIEPKRFFLPDGANGQSYTGIQGQLKTGSHDGSRSSRGCGFSSVMYGCESWTIKKAERRGTDAFELWCWRRLLRVPWTARRCNQPILKEISPEYSLEGLMLKLKLQYFGHLMQRTDSLEKTLMLGKTEGKRRRGRQRMRRLDSITYSLDMKSEQTPEDSEDRGGSVCCSSWGRRVRHDLATEQQLRVRQGPNQNGHKDSNL